MIISRQDTNSFLPEEIDLSVFQKNTSALQGITTHNNNFVVNDTLFFRKQRTGRVTNCVMNSASYISKGFQHNLSLQENSFGETKLNEQNIDGYIEERFDGFGYRILNKNNLLEVIYRYIEVNELSASSIYTLFPMFHGMYVDRGTYNIDNIPSDMHHYFERQEVSETFKVGVEFETGNVASSFRAINKLFILFQQGQIDAGVFITSTDKQTSASRIWPVSNRNGSFQELTQRMYKEQVSLPLMCIGFAPDRFSNTAEFLSKDGTTYAPRSTGEVDSTGQYNVFTGNDGEELLRPRTL